MDDSNLVGEMPRTPTLGPALPKLPTLPDMTVGVTANTFLQDSPVLAPLPSLTPFAGHTQIATSAEAAAAAAAKTRFIDNVPALQRVGILAGGITFGSISVIVGFVMMSK